MLKRLAISALMMGIVQAPVPTPRRTSTGTANDSRNHKSSTTGDQNPSAPTPPLISKPIQPIPADPHGRDEGKEAANAERSVRITTVPPITFTSPITLAEKHKPWWAYLLDWGQWVFAGALAIVGWLQVKLLKRQEKILRGTRREVHTQARLMSRQADLMSRSNVITLATARAASESAKAANAQIKIMKDKERARIKVTPVRVDIVDADEPNNMGLIFLNIGPTNAYGVQVNAGGRIVVTGFDPEEGEYTDLAVSSLLKPNNSDSSWVVCVFPKGWEDEVLYATAKIRIEVKGEVRFEDVFGEIHVEEFYFRMYVYGLSQLPNRKVKLKLMMDWHTFPKKEWTS